MKNSHNNNSVRPPASRRVLHMTAISLAIVFMALTTSLCSRAQAIATTHVRDVVRNGTVKASGELPADRMMNLDVVLPLTNPSGLDLFLRNLYTPSSPSYQHYLTVPEFTARFGPSQKNYDAVVSFAQTHGLTVTGGTRAGSDVQIAGTVATVEAALHISLLTYRHPTGDRDFFSPDREPTVDLPFNLWHISGLDNYSIPRPAMVEESGFGRAPNDTAPAPRSAALTGSAPNGGFLASDLRAAYYGGTALTGAGQNLGIFTYGGTNLADVYTYFNTVHQTNKVPIVLFSTDGSPVNLCPTCHDVEQTLDIIQSIGMAPGLASVIVFIGNSDTSILAAMVSHDPLPFTNSCSWESDADPAPLEPYFKQMAAQGQSFFVASGDNPVNWSLTQSAAGYAEDPWVTGVGGTELITTRAGGPWASETAWVESGGGVSPHKLAIPSWQQRIGVINAQNNGSTTYRNGPDVAANATRTYSCSDTGCGDIGGTSAAAPLWAGYIALINQQRAAVGGNPIGFINPIIYAGNGASSYYNTNFHDITNGAVDNYSATSGYDLTTGWGSPKGGNLMQTPGVAVPAVTFDPGNLAIKEIRSAGLVPKLLGADPGRAYVVSQSPLAGVFVPRGTIISIRLVTGPTP